MKKLLPLLLILSTGLVHAQWNQVTNTTTSKPAPVVPEDSTFVISAPSRAAILNGQGSWTVAPAGGGGAATYYELVFRCSTNGTTLMNYVELENTFPDTWTPDALASGAILLTYDDNGLDLYTINAELYSPGACTYNLVESQSVCTTGVQVQDTHQLGWIILKSSTNGDVVAGAADLESAILTNELQISLRWYY